MDEAANGDQVESGRDEGHERDPGEPGEPASIESIGRQIRVPLAAMGAGRFDFSDLCEKPLGSRDFVRIAHQFDSIVLDNAVFAGIAANAQGRLDSAQFAANATGPAADAGDRIVYETDTGDLFYDADGVGGGARVHFATLSPGLAMTSNEFFVI